MFSSSSSLQVGSSVRNKVNLNAEIINYHSIPAKPGGHASMQSCIHAGIHNYIINKLILEDYLITV